MIRREQENGELLVQATQRESTHQWSGYGRRTRVLAPVFLTALLASCAIGGSAAPSSSEQSRTSAAASAGGEPIQPAPSVSSTPDASATATAQKLAEAQADNEKLRQQIASASAKPAATPDLTLAQSSTCPTSREVDHEMKANETFQAPCNSFITGDVLVNGQRTFDDNEKTGEMVYCPDGCTVDTLKDTDKTKFGADVHLNVTPSIVCTIAREEIDKMKKGGCEGGCSQGVNIWTAKGMEVKKLSSIEELCAVVVPVAAPKGGPTPAGVVVSVCPVKDRVLSPGETVDVVAGNVFFGDAVINGDRWHDSDGQTGETIEFRGPAKLTAPFGGDLECPAREGLTPAQKMDIVDAETVAKGCEGAKGCSKGVWRTFFPGGQKQPGA